MKKMYIIMLVAQSFIILLLLMYAFVQKTPADTAGNELRCNWTLHS